MYAIRSYYVEDFLAHSPANKLNLDIGHYFGSTGKHPNELIEKLHDRIYSIHLKDKTAKNAEPSNTNRPWGEGDTPLADILGVITSYSIHYTKLYEYLWLGVRVRRMRWLSGQDQSMADRI